MSNIFPRKFLRLILFEMLLSLLLSPLLQLSALRGGAGPGWDCLRIGGHGGSGGSVVSGGGVGIGVQGARSQGAARAWLASCLPLPSRLEKRCCVSAL